LAPRSADELRKDIIAASGVFLFGFALYLLPAVCSRPLTNPSEIRVAAVAQEMLRSDDYVAPRFEGQPLLHEPPLPYWLAAEAGRVLSGGGEPGWTVMTRGTLLPPALLGALALFVIVLYGSVVFGRPAGVTAGLVLGFSLLFCRYARLGGGDMALAFACAGLCCGAAWLVSVPRPGVMAALALGISLGLGVLAGALIPVLLLAGPVLVEVLIRRRFSTRKVLFFLAALAVAAAIAGPWVVAASIRQPEAGAALWQWSKVAMGAEGAARDDRLYFYFVRLAQALLPWTILLVAAWPLSLKLCLEGEHHVSGARLLAHSQARFLLLFCGLGFVGLYAFPAQHTKSLLPLLPALALVSGYVLSHFKAPGGIAEESLAWTQLLLGLIGGIVIALLPLLLPAEGELSGIPLALLHGSTGWAISVVLGLAFFAVQFYCARQWVEGKPAAAAIALAIFAYAGLAGWSWGWTHQTEKMAPPKAQAQLLKDAPKE
jgi:4-amino-4-deoxy-L-arabinose transferase-like glycosyltransferase